MKSLFPKVATADSATAPPSGWRLAAVLLGGVALLLLAITGFLAGRLSSTTQPQLPLTIGAVGAVSDDKFSVATGIVSDQAEGFFVLDHNSGVVQCHVYYPRNGQFLASFTANVGEVIGGGKGAKYLMVTGQADMTRGGRSMALSPTVLYVLNTTSGAYAAFAVPFDYQAMAQGRPQAGLLLPMGKGSTNLVPVR